MVDSWTEGGGLNRTHSNEGTISIAAQKDGRTAATWSGSRFPTLASAWRPSRWASCSRSFPRHPRPRRANMAAQALASRSANAFQMATAQRRPRAYIGPCVLRPPLTNAGCWAWQRHGSSGWPPGSTFTRPLGAPLQLHRRLHRLDAFSDCLRERGLEALIGRGLLRVLIAHAYRGLQ